MGYVGTTGLAAMDYLLADRHQVREQDEQFFGERVLRLPDGYVCYDPPSYAPPRVTASRAHLRPCDFWQFQQPGEDHGRGHRRLGGHLAASRRLAIDSQVPWHGRAVGRPTPDFDVRRTRHRWRADRIAGLVEPRRCPAALRTGGHRAGPSGLQRWIDDVRGPVDGIARRHLPRRDVRPVDTR